MFRNGHLENLKRLQEASVPPESLDRARTALLASMAAHPFIPAQGAAWWRRPFVWKPAAALAIVTLAVGGSGAAVFAAEVSLPGDSLYPVKLLVENVHASLAVSAAQKFRLNAQQAERRLDEVAEVMQSQDGSSSAKASRVRVAMENYQAHLTDLSRLAANLASATSTKMSVQADVAADEVARVIEHHEHLVESTSSTSPATAEIEAGVKPALTMEAKVMAKLGAGRHELNRRMQDRILRMQERLEASASSTAPAKGDAQVETHEHVEVTAPPLRIPSVRRPRSRPPNAGHANLNAGVSISATATR